MTFHSRCCKAQGSSVAVNSASLLRPVMCILSLQIKAKKFSFIFPVFVGIKGINYGVNAVFIRKSDTCSFLLDF